MSRGRTCGPAAEVRAARADPRLVVGFFAMSIGDRGGAKHGHLPDPADQGVERVVPVGNFSASAVHWTGLRSSQAGTAGAAGHDKRNGMDTRVSVFGRRERGLDVIAFRAQSLQAGLI